MSKKVENAIIIAPILTLIIALVLVMPNLEVVAATSPSSTVKIFGLVNKPLTLTYDALLSFPTVSEIARLKCVAGLPDVTYNWTGVPLFYLLTLAEAKPEAYKVVTRGSGNFESDLLIEEALNPSVILALRANGTNLPELNGIQGLFRLVVPGKWGYKWVGDVHEIEVVNTDYKGTYESSGWTDEADVPQYVPTSVVPPLQLFTLHFGNRTFEFKVFTNVSISVFDFNYLQNEIDMNITVQPGASGFAVFILQQDMLKGPYSVFLNNQVVDVAEANVTRLMYQYLPFPEGLHTVKIVGAELFAVVPLAVIEPLDQPVYVGQNLTFNASKSVNEGMIVSYDWDFGDGSKGTGPIINHSYIKEGTYQVVLNVTDDKGLSNTQTLVLTVEKSPVDLIGPIKIGLAIAAVAIALTFIVLMLRRRTED